MVALACVAGISACSPSGSFKVTSIPEDQTLRERIVDRATSWTSDRVAIIDISGTLLNAQEMGFLSEGEHIVSLLVEKLDRAARDKRVKAVVLRINSPGGTVTASDILHSEIQRFRQRTGKPIIAYFQDVAASGAYYLACATDEIIAERSCVTGSIGVILQMVDLSGTMAKLGISTDAITSGPYKDAGSPFRKMQPREREVFQGLVDDFYQQFVSIVAEGREKLSRKDVLALADGRVYTASQALENGLVDRVGTLREAIAAALGRAGIKTAHTVMYHRPMGWTPNIYAQSPPTSGSTINLFNINTALPWSNRPRLMYLWTVE